MDARIRTVAILLTVPLALGACGTAAKDSSKNFRGEQAKVATVVEDLQTAGQKRDSAKICTDLLAQPLVAQIQRASKQPCKAALDDRLTDADAFEIQVTHVTITGDRATAVVSSQAGSQKHTSTLHLQRVGGAWRIATLG